MYRSCDRRLLRAEAQGPRDDLGEPQEACVLPLTRLVNANRADLWLWVYLSVRFSIRDLDKDFHQSEEDIKALQSVGQIIGEVLKKLDDERCAYHPFPLLFPLPSALLLFYCCFEIVPSEGLELTSRLSTVIVKASSGPRYVVSYRPQLPVEKVRSDLLLSSRKGC